jgi:hypothetical protein
MAQIEQPRHFTFGQALYWFIHYDELSHGIIPDPKSSEAICAKVSFHEAGFWKPCELAAELALRVKRCWPDGTLVEARFMRPGGLRSIRAVAEEYFLRADDVYRLINCVIAYVSEGWAFPPMITGFSRGGIKSVRIGVREPLDYIKSDFYTNWRKRA